MKKHLKKCLSIATAVGSLLLIPQAQATTLTATQVGQAAYQTYNGASIAGSALVNAIAIASAESDFWLEATNINSNGTIDRGLWQINSIHNYTASLLLSSASYNAWATYNISKYNPVNGGDWLPWVAFKNGRFAQNNRLVVARNAATQIDPKVIRGNNDTVSATATYGVRPSAGSATVTRNVSAGTTGTIIGGPVVAVKTGGNANYYYIWWNIHWNDGGADGWSEEDRLVRSSVPPLPNMSLNYNGTAIPNGDQSPTTAKGTDFGTVNYGSESPRRTFTIKNDGTGPLNLTGTTRIQKGGNNPDDFWYYAPQPSSPVGAGGSTTFILAFEPTVRTGLRTATITIPNDDPNKNPYTFKVQGTAYDPPTVDPQLEYNGAEINTGDQNPTVNKGTDFASVNVGSQSATRTFQFYNYGNANMTLTGSKVQLTGANSGDFAIVSMPSSPIAPNGGNSTIGIRFQPTGSGVRTASMLIYFDATYASGITSPYTVALKGTGSATYTINAAVAGSGGGINPSGNIIKNAGDSQAFTTSPNANYVVNQWLVDGSVVQNGGSGYTLSNIQANRSVQVTFMQASSPKISNPKRTETAFTVSVTTQIGFTYYLDYKNSITDAWTPPAASTPGTGGTITLTDPSPSGSRRFYRVRVQ